MIPEEIDLDIIEARAAAVTAGPWKVESMRFEGSTPYYGVRSAAKGWNMVVRAGREGFGHGANERDAEFIAHARTDVPALLALVREQAFQLEGLRAMDDNTAIPEYRAVITKGTGDVFYTVELRRFMADGSDMFVDRAAQFTLWGARRWARKMCSAHVSGRVEIYREEIDLPK